jgi:hypothetical protein
MIYTHVLKVAAGGTTSPLDRLIAPAVRLAPPSTPGSSAQQLCTGL